MFVCSCFGLVGLIQSFCPEDDPCKDGDAPQLPCPQWQILGLLRYERVMDEPWHKCPECNICGFYLLNFVEQQVRLLRLGLLQVKVAVRLPQLQPGERLRYAICSEARAQGKIPMAKPKARSLFSCRGCVPQGQGSRLRTVNLSPKACRTLEIVLLQGILTSCPSSLPSA